ncbi:MAG: hypothetical protein Q8L90_14535 [Bacteroidota bacterium]|nr:hypothetical protein [Bacteroidota bacterium]
MTKLFQKLSLVTLICSCLLIGVYRINTVDKKEISWDILGYYMCLPATFIHHDPMLKDITWLKEANQKNDLTGTLYQISSNDKGEPMYVFLFGMALFFLPFFFLGHGIAGASGYAMDGFSLPYQYAMVIGGIIYTIIGLIYLRKVLRHFFSEGVSSLVMLIVVFGTNYIHHLTLKNLETVNVLFMLVCIIVWNTIQWHKNFKAKHLFTIGISITLMVLIKPSEAFIIILPLMWNVFSFDSFKQKIVLLFSNKKVLFLTAAACLLLVFPQLWYWHTKTGHYIYDSYINPGVGLDLFSPHILNVLFSYRKGWFVYTPVMLFSIVGFYFLYKNSKHIFYAILFYFLISFYIICSWTYWYYGAAFSCRPVITSYPLLAICLGYFLLFVQKQSIFIKSTFALVLVFFVFLNQFQWWQLKNYILDPYRTTKDYYWATFLKTSVDENDRNLLSVNRDFTGQQKFENKTKYRSFLLKQDTFDATTSQNIQTDSAGNSYYKALPDEEFCITNQYMFRELTEKDHVWIKVSMDIRFPPDFQGPLPCMAMTMEHKGGAYGYFAPEITIDSTKKGWYRYELEYLTPEIRNTKDVWKCYIWKRGKGTFDIDNFKIEIYEPNY